MTYGTASLLPDGRGPGVGMRAQPFKSAHKRRRRLPHPPLQRRALTAIPDPSPVEGEGRTERP